MIHDVYVFVVGYTANREGTGFVGIEELVGRLSGCV